MRRILSLFSFACASIFILATNTHAADEALTAKLQQAAAIQSQITEKLRAGDKEGIGELNQQLATLGKAICADMQQFLPGKDTDYGKFDWTCNYNAGTLMYTVQNEQKRPLFRVQVLYHPQGTDPKKRGMFTTVLDHPAMLVTGQRIWLLAGKIEIHLNAIDESVRKNDVMTSILQAMNLKALSEL